MVVFAAPAANDKPTLYCITDLNTRGTSNIVLKVIL